MREYICAPEQDVVLNSRVRILRNFEDLPFSPKLDRAYADEVTERVSKAVFEGPHGAAFMLLRMRELEDDARSRLLEHELISRDLIKHVSRSAAMLSTAGTISILLGGEDHICFQGLLPGLQLERCAEMALSLDERIGEKYDYAFDEQFGFLTARTRHFGTGLSATVLMHLPALTRARQIGGIVQSIAKSGVMLRALNEDDEGAQGELYRLTNTVTLGLREEEILRRVSEAAMGIALHERAAREEIEKKDMLSLQDGLLRAYGETRHARLMSVGDLMKHWSAIRYASCMGYLHLPLPALDALLMDLQPGSLGSCAGHIIGEREAEILRARTLREELEKLETDTED